MVREARNLPEVIHIDVTKNATDLETVARVPDIVNHITEVRRVVGDAEFIRPAVSRPECERVSHPIPREVAVAVVAQILVPARDAPLSHKIVHAAARR